MSNTNKDFVCSNCGADELEYLAAFDYPEGGDGESNQGGYCLGCGKAFQAVVEIKFVKFVPLEKV